MRRAQGMAHETYLLLGPNQPVESGPVGCQSAGSFQTGATLLLSVLDHRSIPGSLHAGVTMRVMRATGVLDEQVSFRISHECGSNPIESPSAAGQRGAGCRVG